MKLEPIRLRLIPRQPLGQQQSPREEFWKSIHPQSSQRENLDITEYEGRIVRHFGLMLHGLLIGNLRHTLNEFLPIDRDFEHLFFRLEKSSGTATLDAITRLLEQRHQIVRDSPALQNVQERLTKAHSVTFSVRLAGYSSLNLDLSIGSFKSLVEVFDNDFESFRVFLEVYVPDVFGQVFDNERADRTEFLIQIPNSYEQAFADSGKTISSLPEPSNASPSTALPTSSRDRAEWLWRLANGSLLVPVVLSLVVMYFGMVALRDIRGSQNDALKPILDHQIKLLEEDRRRLFKDASGSESTSKKSDKDNAKGIR